MKKILMISIVIFGLTGVAKPSIRADFIKRLQKKVKKTKKGAYQMDVSIIVHSGRGDMKLNEKIFRQGKNLRVETQFIRGGNSKKMPAMFANMKTVTIRTDKGTWMISPMGSHKVKNKGLPPGLEATGWVTRIASHIGRVNKIKKGYLVELKNSGKWTEALFSNGLDIVQMIGRNKLGKSMKMLFSEYSDEGGIHMPHHLTTFMGKQRIMDMKVVKIKRNQSISPALFDPAQVKIKPMAMPQGL